MQDAVNDRWDATIAADQIGRHEFVVEAWRDRFATWRHDVEIKAAVGDDLELELEEGARILESLAARRRRPGPQAGARGRRRAAAARRAACRSGSTPGSTTGWPRWWPACPMPT